MKKDLTAAAEYIYHNGILYKFGTGANSISTEACLKQQAFIENKFGISHTEFGEAFRMAELLEKREAEAEAAFFKSHPELNP